MSYTDANKCTRTILGWNHGLSTLCHSIYQSQNATFWFAAHRSHLTAWGKVGPRAMLSRIGVKDNKLCGSSSLRLSNIWNSSWIDELWLGSYSPSPSRFCSYRINIILTTQGQIWRLTITNFKLHHLKMLCNRQLILFVSMNIVAGVSLGNNPCRERGWTDRCKSVTNVDRESWKFGSKILPAQGQKACFWIFLTLRISRDI